MSQPGLREQLLGILENVSEHSRLVLIMDGFDEISDKDKKIEQVITGVTYQNIHSITTCRPHVIGDNVLSVDVEIRLKGFSEAQAKLFVEMFARIEYSEQDQIVTFVTETMSQIESSADLLEMSTNPSMLQMLCHLLAWNKGKIGKDRTSIFKDYTRYLLMQYHIKLGEIELYSEDLYKKYLLDAGKVALMGLKQNQLQLVFSESEVHYICGTTIFDIGFLIKLPNTDTESVKVQFTHKTLQEYLAAYYVVNTPGDEGLQHLMEFCSTSQRLMGSQIILEFISNMSTDIMGKEIQNKIKNFVSKWDSDDKVNPRNRTSFLISMLEGNETLKFPLPAVIDIELDFFIKKSALEMFFGMDGQGVRKIILTLRENNRLNVLENVKTDSIDELNIIWLKPWSREDYEDLCEVVKKIKPGLLSIRKIQIDTEIAEAVSRLPDDVQLDLSDNKLTKMDIRLLPGILIHMPQQEEIDMTMWKVTIDVDIVKALSKLPRLKSLKASYNKLTPEAAREFSMSQLQHLDLCECGINDTVCVSLMISLSEHCPLLEVLKLIGNNLTSDEWCSHVQKKLLRELNLSYCGINDTVCVSLMISLSEHCPLLETMDLDGNNLASDDWCHHVQMKQLRELSLSNCGISDNVCMSLMISLSKHCPLLEVLELDDNNLTSDEWCHHVQMKQLRELSLSSCDINETVCVSLMISLSKHCPLLEVLNFSKKLTFISIYFLSYYKTNNNNLTSGDWCHHVQMKQLKELRLSDCGINDIVCVPLMISLSKHCPLLEVLYLSNKRFGKGSNNLISDVWCHHVQMKNLRELYLSKCGISDTVCVSLMISLSRHCPLLEMLSLKDNNLTSGDWCHHVQMKQLKELRLSDCAISDSVCVPLMISLSKHCPLLKKLSLTCNNLSSSCVLEIVDSIKHMKNLVVLELYGNPCKEDQRCMEEVTKALQKPNIYFPPFFSCFHYD